MTHESGILLLTAASVGTFHTLLGPDHYVPFIVLSRARGWTTGKTALITLLCGLGHVGSSVIIGFAGIYLGTAINRLTGIESARAEIAAWFMIAFGFIYMVWGIRQAIRRKEHFDARPPYSHSESARNSKPDPVHSHIYRQKNYKELTPWILFVIFVLGPCEPFIPVLLYPAAQHHFSDMILVTAVFTLTTTGTMLLMVCLSVLGLGYVPKVNLQRYLHVVAGSSVFLCGVGIRFLGL